MKAIHFTLVFISLLFSSLVFSQQNNVGINTTTPDPSAAMEVVSKSNNQGILIPRLTTIQRTGITSPANGLMVYDSTTKTFWFFDGTNWVDIGATSIPTKIEDADMDTAVETIEGTGGDTDVVNVNVDGNTKFKFIEDRLESDNINGNLFVGQTAGKDNTGSGNTFLGNGSGAKNNSGFSNTFIGNKSGSKNTSGNANVFLGHNAGIENTIGIKNTFLGRYAGSENTEGDDNIFIGYSAGESIVSGGNNIFIGNQTDLGSDVSNKLVIENNLSSIPLIYGEFDNDLLRVNGTFNINNAFSFPTADGAANQILATDGSGILSWTTPSAPIPTKIEDADMDTSVEAIDGPGATDKIEFSVDGNTQWRFVKDRLESINLDGNLFIGDGAGGLNVVNSGLGEGILNTFIGSSSGLLNSSGSRNTFVGRLAGLSNSTGTNNTFIGLSAGTGNTTGGINICIGPSSGFKLGAGAHNIFVGSAAGHDNTKIDNVFIGSEAGFMNDGEKNIFIGRSAGGNELGSEKLYIENTSSASPLIYGEFDNDLLRINGTLNINNAFSFPTSDGAVNQILATDGSGTLSWTTPSASSIPSKIEDADMDTSVEAIDGTGNTDKIEFTVNGTSTWEMTKDRLEETNGSDNIFIGKNTGNATTSATESVFVGTNAGISNATGDGNVYLGKDAGATNVAGTANVYVGHSSGSAGAGGSNNTFLGGQAGALATGNQNTYVGQLAGGGVSSDGEGNVFLGFNAGQLETGDNKLFIENSSSPDPLIYGEFDNNLLRVNGTLNINNAFSFPTTDGMFNQILTTDGLGNLFWTTASGGGSTSKIEDTDMDTWVETIDGAGVTDIIQFVVNGDPHWIMEEDRIEEVNSDGNIFIGQSTGISNLPNPSISEGTRNIFIGTNSGISNSTGYGNTFLGNTAGFGSSSGSNNTFIGTESGLANTTGDFNTLVGTSAGAANGSGASNAILGSYAGIMLSGGQENVLLGTVSANSLTSGNRNVFIGNGSALSLPSGSDNIFIGNQAGGLINSSTSNTLIIENSNATTPLIWGDFTNDRLGINRQATTNALEVEGEASKTTAGSWIGNSDARLKKNIENLNSEEILQKLLQLQGVNYEWNDTQTGAKRPEGKQYGFIAQNIQKVFPELVKEDNLGYLQTAYGTYDAMQIEAMRALLNRIEKLENENQELKTALSDIETIKADLAELKGMAKN